MTNKYEEKIQQFITANQLKKQGELLLFDAVIHLYNDNHQQTFQSQVHIISMHHVTAVYVYELFKNSYHTPEMYSTEEYQFSCNNRELAISKMEADGELLLSIKPAANSA